MVRKKYIHKSGFWEEFSQIPIARAWISRFHYKSRIFCSKCRRLSSKSHRILLWSNYEWFWTIFCLGWKRPFWKDLWNEIQYKGFYETVSSLSLHPKVLMKRNPNYPVLIFLGDSIPSTCLQLGRGPSPELWPTPTLSPEPEVDLYQKE